MFILRNFQILTGSTATVTSIAKNQNTDKTDQNIR